MYENINIQFNKIVSLPLKMAFIDKENLIPRQIYNFSKFFENLSSDFWQWTKTLPNYDPEILYSMTFNQGLLQS